MGKLYKGMDEFRWSKVTSTQGHYPLLKNWDTALNYAKKMANQYKMPVVIQKWKPSRSKRIYIVRPKGMKEMSKKTLISYFKDMGYDISYIRASKYVLKG